MSEAVNSQIYVDKTNLIARTKKYGEHSALNMFTEYSMTNQDVFEEYKGEILLVGINYDRNKADKPHSCIIEKMEKYKM